MDAIDRAIEKRKHISGNQEWNSQQWDDFYKTVAEKYLFVFGVGESLTDFFLDNGDIRVEAVIDNDAELCSFRADDVVAGLNPEQVHFPQISDSSILKRYPTDQVVVLITSINYYKEIAQQVEKIGINQIFIYLCMEAKRRSSDKTDYPDIEARHREWAQKCAIHPIDQKKIIFEVLTHGETSRRVTECLLDICPDLDIVWIVSRKEETHGRKIRCVHKKNWMKYIHEMETAAIWAWETIIPEFLHKREGQIYLYLKHWSITLKNVGPNIVMAKSDWYNTDNQIENAKQMDYVLGCSRFDQESFRISYNGICNVIDVGSPKADVLFLVDDNRKKVCEYYGLDSNEKLAIYAPTFRWMLDGKSSFEVTAERIAIDYRRFKQALVSKFGGDWRVCVRLHPVVAAQSDLLNIPDDVLDLSKYRHAEELISAADVVVTDYSSVMFEAGYLLKPVFIYATDQKEYVERERDLLMRFDELPFSVAESDIELEKNIRNFDEQQYQHNLRDFLDGIGSHEDGHSGERAAEFIKDLIRQNEVSER